MPFKGCVDEITRSRVRGWVFDPDRPSEMFVVAVTIDDREVGRCTADRHRDDLEALTGSGNHEFCFDFDPPLSPFRGFTVQILIPGHPEPIPGGTKVLPAPQPPRASGQLVPILLTSTGRAGTTLLMRELLGRPEILVAGQYPFEIKLINYYAAAFRALAGNEDRANSTNPDRMFAEENRKRIGHNPYNSPGHHGFARDRAVFEDFFEETIPVKLACLFRDLILQYYSLVKADGDKTSPVFFAEKSVLDDAPRQAARLFFSDVREVVIVRDPRDLTCSAMSFWNYSTAEALKMLGETLPLLEAIHDAAAPDTFFLRYEDLINYPMASRDAMYRFIGVDASKLDFVHPDKDLFKVHGTSRDPAASIGRWQSELSRDEIAGCDTAFASFMERFGYMPSQRPLRGHSRTLEILFGTTGNSSGYLRDGWSGPEAGFTWTLGCESRLQFPKPAPDSTYVLEVRVRPFVVPDLPSQRISVVVNDVPVGVAIVETPTVLRFAVPWTVLAANSTTTVIFSLPDAARPSEFKDSQDRRRLAFAFEKLALLCDGEPARAMMAPTPETDRAV